MGGRFACAAAVTAVAVAGCGGGGEAPAGTADGERVAEELFGYELRLPASWRSLGRADKESPLRFGGGGEECGLQGGVPAPPIDDPDALLREARKDYERVAGNTPGSSAEFGLVSLPGAVAVEVRTTGPGPKRGVTTRIASASASILLFCETEASRLPEVHRDLRAIYRTVRLRTSPVAERLQPQLARMPAVMTAEVIDEPHQLTAFVEVDDVARAEPSVLRGVRLLHREARPNRVALVAEDPFEPGPTIQARIEKGSGTIAISGAGGRTRRIPLDG